MERLSTIEVWYKLEREAALRELGRSTNPSTRPAVPLGGRSAEQRDLPTSGWHEPPQPISDYYV